MDLVREQILQNCIARKVGEEDYTVGEYLFMDSTNAVSSPLPPPSFYNDSILHEKADQMAGEIVCISTDRRRQIGSRQSFRLYV